jgi:hypothetical protein
MFGTTVGIVSNWAVLLNGCNRCNGEGQPEKLIIALG